MAESLEGILVGSLEGFIEDIQACGWWGREREAISLYAFGYLAAACERDSVLKDPGQIGIEVAVPQVPGAKRKRQVCKDLVVWPKPRMTCWNENRQPVVHPLAVMQWKTGGIEMDRRDAEWLKDYTSLNPRVAGYAVALRLDEKPYVLALTRFRGGKPGPRRLFRARSTVSAIT